MTKMAIPQPIFKLGPTAFAQEQIQTIPTDDADDDDDDDNEDDDDDDNNDDNNDDEKPKWK